MEGKWKEGMRCERRETPEELCASRSLPLGAILSHLSDLSQQGNVCLSNPKPEGVDMFVCSASWEPCGHACWIQS